MKKIFLKLLLFVFIFTLSAVGFNKYQESKCSGLSALTMNNIEALASGESTKECPGGYCSRTNSVGEKCEACCPSERKPECDSFGCRCN